MFPFLLFAAALLVATVSNGATEHLPAFVLRVTAVAAVVAVWPRDTVTLRVRDLVVPTAALLLLLFALPGAVSFGPGLQAFLKVGFVLVVFIGALAAPRRATALALVAATGVGTIHALWAVVQRLFMDAARGTGGFFNPNDLAAFLAPLLVLGFARATTAPTNAQWFSNRRMATATTAVLAAGLLATGSRSGLLAAAVGTLLLALGRARRAAIAGAIVLLVLTAAVPDVRERFLGMSDAYAYSRVNIWQQAAQVAWRTPLGVGLGGFETTMQRQGVPLEADVRYPKVARNAHSEMMYAWVELGWPGLVLVGLPAAMILVLLWRRRRVRPLAADAGVLAAFAIPALVSTSLHVPPIAYLAALWAGRLVARDESPGTEIRVHGRMALVVLSAGLLIAALPGVIAYTSLTRAAVLRDRGDLDGAHVNAARATRFAPWSAGAAVMLESVRYARGESALDVAERLVALADVHESRYEPLARAAALLEREARMSGAPELWALAAAIRARELERDPFNALTWVALGRARHESGDAPAALEAFERAVEIEPLCARALVHLAAFARMAGDNERAHVLARAALDAQRRARGYGSGDYAHQVLSFDPVSQNILRESDWMRQPNESP